jgi:hypothetical protein
MLLGTLIKHAMQAQGPFAEEIGERDPKLATRIADEAGRHGMDSRGFIADTVQRFMGAEDSESWTTIIGNVQRADDPGYAFIETVLRERLNHRCDHQER